VSLTSDQTVQGRVAERPARITVARTAEEVEALRPKFERLPPKNLDADLDFFLTVVRHREEIVIRPHVMHLELADGREIGIVARLERKHGPRRLTRRPLRFLQVAFGGVVGAETPTDDELVVRILRDTLANDEADVVALPMVEESTSLYRLARTGVRWWRVDHMPAKSVHWMADVPDSLETFIASRGRQTRANLRKRTRQLVSTYGDELTIREFSAPEHLDELTAALESVTAKTYQRGLGVGYTGDRLQRALMELGAQRGWLRASVVYIGETPAAFNFGYCYRGTLYSVATSFDPSFGSGIGLYIQVQMLGGMCQEGDVRLWDWGSGYADYKERLSDRRLDEAEILLFGPSMRAVLYNAVRSARVAGSSTAKAWIANTDLGGRVKKTWRKGAERRARAQLED
jgi:Acetyltransferase (GNAT) domain